MASPVVDLAEMEGGHRAISLLIIDSSCTHQSFSKRLAYSLSCTLPRYSHVCFALQLAEYPLHFRNSHFTLALYKQWVVVITENYQNLPKTTKTYQKLNYRKLTLTLSPTLTLSLNPNHKNPYANLKPYTLIITEFSVSFRYR